MGLKFPVHEKDHKKNNISISVFGYEYKISYPICTFKQTFEKHVDLLLLSSRKNSLYLLVKHFDQFMANKINHHCKKVFC